MRRFEGLAETLRAALEEDGFLVTVDGLLGMQAKLPCVPLLNEWVALLNKNKTGSTLRWICPPD